MSLIADPNDPNISFSDLKKRYNEKQTVKQKPLYDQVKDAVLIHSGDPAERLAPITPSGLKKLPIPQASSIPVLPKRKYKWQGAGTTPKFPKKLHCFHCGRKRLMRIATTALDLDASVRLVYFKMRKLLKTMKQDTHIKMPEMFIGSCSICLENTFFTMNKNRKLVVTQEIENQIQDQVLKEVQK